MIRNPIVNGGRAAGAIVPVTLRRPTEPFGPVETRGATATLRLRPGTDNKECAVFQKLVVPGSYRPFNLPQMSAPVEVYLR